MSLIPESFWKGLQLVATWNCLFELVSESLRCCARSLKEVSVSSREM